LTPRSARPSANAAPTPSDAPAHIAGDYPEWLDGYLAQVFGEDEAAQLIEFAGGPVR